MREVVQPVVREVVRPLTGDIGGIPFLLTSTGDGTGVSTLTVTVSGNTTFKLDGTARFYSDAGGTLNESTTWVARPGAARTRYIRCPSATANFIISGNTITSWGPWTSGGNAARLSGDISKLTALTYIDIEGDNIISGDMSGLTGLTGLIVYGANTLSGSVSALILLSILEVSGSNALSGSFSALTSLAFLWLPGLNTVTGDLSLISAGLTYCNIRGDNQIVTYTAGGDWSSIPDQGDIDVRPGVGYGLSSAEVDLFIIEVEDTRAANRHLHLTLTGSNAPRSAASDAAVTALENDGGTVTTN